MHKIIIPALLMLLFAACSSTESVTKERKQITIPEINLLEIDYYSDAEIDNDILSQPFMSELRSKVGYPVEARKRGLEGRVEVEALISPEGKAFVTNLKQRIHPMLDNLVINAIKETTFQPGILNGKPVNVLTSIPIIFKLPKKPFRNFN